MIAPPLLQTSIKINLAELATFAVEALATLIVVAKDWETHECRISTTGIKIQTYFMARLIYAVVMLLLRGVLESKEASIYKRAKMMEIQKEEESEELRKEHTVHDNDCRDHAACTGNEGKCTEHALLFALRKRETFLATMIAGLTMVRTFAHSCTFIRVHSFVRVPISSSIYVLRFRAFSNTKASPPDLFCFCFSFLKAFNTDVFVWGNYTLVPRTFHFIVMTHSLHCDDSSTRTFQRHGIERK